MLEDIEELGLIYDQKNTVDETIGGVLSPLEVVHDVVGSYRKSGRDLEEYFLKLLVEHNHV